MTTIEALTAFWRSFGVSAYEESSVPSGTAYPYITFTMADGFLGDSAELTANYWTRSDSFGTVVTAVAEIFGKIGRGGKVLTVDDGAIWLKRSHPFAWYTDDPNDKTIKTAVINYTAEFVR